MFRGNIIKAFFSITPMLGVGILGAYNQTSMDMPVAPEYGPLNHSRINEYTPAIRFSQSLVSNLTHPASVAESYDSANFWIQRHQKGLLRDIPQVAPDDNARSGVKAEILSARGCIEWHLSRNAIMAHEKGNDAVATECLVKVIELADIGRRSDIIFLSQSNSTIHAALMKMKNFNLKLSQDQLKRINSVISDHAEVRQALTLVKLSWTSDLMASRSILSHATRNRLNRYVENPSETEGRNILAQYGSGVMGQSLINARAVRSAQRLEQEWQEIKTSQARVVASSVVIARKNPV